MELFTGLRYQRIIESIPLKEVLEQYAIKVKTSGQLSCPFHGIDRHPSAKVYPDNSFHCFTCGRSYNAIDIVKHLKHVNSEEAISIIERDYGIKEELSVQDILIAKLQEYRTPKPREFTFDEAHGVLKNIVRGLPYENLCVILPNIWGIRLFFQNKDVVNAELLYEKTIGLARRFYCKSERLSPILPSDTIREIRENKQGVNREINKN